MVLEKEENISKELDNEGIRVVEVPAKSFGTRKIFINLKPEYTKFIIGQRVLPAIYVGQPEQGSIYFKKTHQPGEIGYKDGSHECYSEGGAIYNFFLDALMIHPTEIKNGRKIEINKSKVKVGKEVDITLPKRGRGRPAMNPEDRKTPVIYIKKGTPRGRKALSPEEKLKRELENKLNSTSNTKTGKRGRPALPDELKKPKKQNNGGKKGRPSLPDHLKKPPKEKKYGFRGRPPKLK